jgi:hypothetical protein
MAEGIGILNVGAGDTKLVFDKSNPAEMIRSARIVKDMLRRGYALLIEVDDGKGGKSFQRVTAFREDTSEYIIADFDPVQAAEADARETPPTPAAEWGDSSVEEQEDAAAAADAAGTAPNEQNVKPKGKRGPKTRAVPASGTRGVAVARSAGG